MARNQASANGRGDDGYFCGLIPGPRAMESDWDVGDLEAVKRMDPRSLVAWMADPARPQPLMSDGIDDDL